MRRMSILAMVVLMSWVSLGACYLGPDPVQYAALAMVGGRPTAILAVCGRPVVDVVLYQNDNTADGDYHPWSVTVTPPKPVREIEVELFGAARPGWQITSTRAKFVPLTSIDPGHRYALDSSKGGPEGASAPAVDFTTDDLATIGADQVLAPVDHRHSELVARDAFVKERCG